MGNSGDTEDRFQDKHSLEIKNIVVDLREKEFSAPPSLLTVTRTAGGLCQYWFK